MMKLAELIKEHQIDVHDYLDREEIVPVYAGLQFQGDVAVVPEKSGKASKDAKQVPAEGIAVVRGENGGNTHALVASGAVTFAPESTGLSLGTLSVAEGATAYLSHPEHGYLGIAPGNYNIRRQREQADEIRVVAD